MTTTEPDPDTVGHVEHVPATYDPHVAVKLMLTEVELTRAQLGLGPSTGPQQPTLRDLSPFGR